MNPTTTAGGSAEPRVGFIGLGSIGLPMATRIRGAGLALHFVARRAEVVDAATALGGVRVSSPAELGEQADVVVVCVFDDDQLQEVVLGPDGALGAMGPGSVLVSHTTGSPTTLEEIEAQAAERGVAVLDAAFSGSAHDIEAGTLTVLAGGPDDVLERARPVIATYADPIIHVGRVGDGQRVKLLNNALLAAGVALVADTERVATDLGLDPAAALAAIAECSGASFALDVVRRSGSAAVAREVVGPYLRKDVAAARAAATSVGVDLGLLGTTADRAIAEPATGGA